MTYYSDAARKLTEEFRRRFPEIPAAEVVIVPGEVQQIFENPAGGTVAGQLQSRLNEIVRTADAYLEQKVASPQAAPGDPACQAWRRKWSSEKMETCGCSFAHRYRLACEHEHAAEEWLCGCCLRAESRTCSACAQAGHPGVPLTIVPVEDLGPSSGDVPPSVQHRRERLAGEGEDWFRGLGE